MTRLLTTAALTATVLVIATSPGGATPTNAASKRPADVQRLLFSASKYPNIRRHLRAPCCGVAGRAGRS